VSQAELFGAGDASGCVFCRVVSGETPAAVVLDDEVAIAFLDHRPLFAGHCLLVPRAHHETLADLPAGQVGPLFGRARRLARAVEQATEAQGSFIAINNRISQSVPHLHVHIVPRRQGDGLKGFFWPRQKYASAEAMEQLRARIAAAVAG